MIISRRLLTLVIISFAFVIPMSAYANEALTILTNETFEIVVDNTSKEAAYTMNFSFLIPPYKNATLLLEYTNEIAGTIIERSTLSEVSVVVDETLLLTKKWSTGVQAFSLERTVLVTPNVNHTGRIVLLGHSEAKLMGTINMHIFYIASGSDDGIFNPFDVNANWPIYMIMIASVGLTISVLAMRRRRRGGEV